MNTNYFHSEDAQRSLGLKVAAVNCIGFANFIDVSNPVLTLHINATLDKNNCQTITGETTQAKTTDTKHIKYTDLTPPKSQLNISSNENFYL